MAWIKTQPRLTQCYVQVLAWLNDCHVKPDGAEIKPWIREELNDIDPPVTAVEAGTVIYGMYQEKVRFFGDALSQGLFEKHPMFKGNALGKTK